MACRTSGSRTAQRARSSSSAIAAIADVAFVTEPLARYRINTTGIAARVEREGRTRAEYASAVAHVASWPGLPDSRRAAARIAAEAWTYVLAGSRGRVSREVAGTARQIEVAWGLRRRRRLGKKRTS